MVRGRERERHSALNTHTLTHKYILSFHYVCVCISLLLFILHWNLILLQIVWKNQYEYGNASVCIHCTYMYYNMLNADTIIGCQNEVDFVFICATNLEKINLSASNLIHTAGM